MPTPITTDQDLLDTLDLARAERLLGNSLIEQRDALIARIQNRFEHKIKAHQTAEGAHLKQAQAYATKHRLRLLGKGVKSAAVGPHTLGWEDNGGAVKCLRGSSEKKVIERLLKSPRLRRLFLRHKPSLDKTAIAAKWASHKAALRAVGVTYRHDEHFFVELDLTQHADTRISPERKEAA